MKDDEFQCPVCREWIKRGAVVCRYCGADLTKTADQLARERAKKAKAARSSELQRKLVKGGCGLVGLPFALAFIAFVALSLYFWIFM